ncbi:MAG: hypothetical protein ABWY93_24545 [Mycobacterium sp.]
MAPFPPGLADHLAAGRFGEVTLVTVEGLTDDEKAVVPAWFVDVLAHDGPDGVIAATNHWQSVVPGLLDDAAELFRDLAAGIYLGREMRLRGALVLIYVLRSESRPFICWYGYLPTDHLDNRSPKPEMRPGEKVDLTQVSGELRAFYTQVHNWFCLVGLGECGLPPLNELFTLDGDSSDYEYWDQEGNDYHGRHPEPDQLLPVFISSNGNLCVELDTENAWEQDDSIIEPVGELWPSLNAWIRRFTEELC